MRENMSDEGTMWEKIGEKDGLVRVDRSTFADEIVKKQSGQEWKALVVLLILAIPLAIIGWMFIGGNGIFVTCGPDEFVIVQSPTGNVTVIDKAGIHFKGLGSYWVYPRRIDMRFGPTSATFNDGKVRGINTYALVQLPKNNVDRIELHIFMVGDQANIRRFTESAVINALKLTAPTMSSVDVMAAYKHTFVELVEGQLRQGLYKYHQIETDDGFKTEVIRDENDIPVVGAEPVFAQYFLEIIQFSIVSMQTPAEEIEAMRRENIARNMVIKAELEASVAKAEAEAAMFKVHMEAQRDAAIAEIEADKAEHEAETDPAKKEILLLKHIKKNEQRVREAEAAVVRATKLAEAKKPEAEMLD